MSTSTRVGTSGRRLGPQCCSVCVLLFAACMVLSLPTSVTAQTTACCSVYGCYDDLTPTDCAAAGDVSLPEASCNEQSGQDECEPKGACCTESGCLDTTTETECQAEEGTYLADGASCADGTCDLSGVEPDCECDDPEDKGGTCVAPPEPEAITLRKKIDIAIYNGADANGPSRYKILLKNPQVNRLAKVPDVKAAVKAICATWRRAGKAPINVVISGHGSPGNQQVGTEFMGNRNVARQDAQTEFIMALKGKIKDLTLLGCSTAKGSKGQAFLKKLRSGIQASSVKGYTDIVFLDVANNRYLTAGAKKKNIIPATSGWSLIAMTLLVIGAAAFVSLRLNRPAPI